MAKRRGGGKRSRAGGSVPRAPGAATSGAAQDDWASWRRSEALLAAAGSRNRPPRELSGDLAWCWRAMRALDDGRRSEIEQIAVEARAGGASGVAWVLEVLLADAAKLDPTSLRLAAKTHGAGASAGFAYLDLLRVLACYRTGDRINRSPALGRAVRQRPVLRGVLDLMQQREPRPENASALRRRSRRLEALWVVALIRQTDPAGIRERLASSLDEFPLDLSPERWPDLDRPASVPGLRAWLAGEGRGAEAELFRQGFHEEIEALCQQPEGERREVLGALLTRIADLLGGPRPPGALPAVRAAVRLAESLPGLEELVQQLAHVGVRLCWIDSDEGAPASLLTQLWRHMSARPLSERGVVGRQIALAAEDFEAEIRSEALLAATVAPATFELRRCCAGVFGDAFTTDALEAALAEGGEIPDWERLVVLGQHYRASGRGPAAAEVAIRLTTCPEAGAEGARLLAELLLEAAGRAGLVAGGPGLEASLKRRAGHSALLAAVSALARGGAPERLAPLVPALLAVPAALGARKALPVLAELRPSIERALAAASESDGSAALERALAYQALGDEDAAAGAFRDFGRALRRSNAGEGAERAALRGAGRLTEALELCGRGPARRALKSWLESTTAFLTRGGPEALCELVESYQVVDPEEVAGIAQWCIRNGRHLDDDTCWYRLLRQGLELAAKRHPLCVRGYLKRSVDPLMGHLPRDAFEEVFAPLGALLAQALRPPRLPA